MRFTLEWTGRSLTYYCKHSLQTSELAPSNSPPQMARWREKREMGQEEEQQPGNSVESPSTELWHSTWSCRCAQEQEQSKAALPKAAQGHISTSLPGLRSSSANPGCSSSGRALPGELAWDIVFGGPFQQQVKRCLRHLC